MNEIIYPIILTYEQKRASIQNLSFEYAELLLKKLRIDFGDVQKKSFEFIGDDYLYTNLGLLISDQCLHSIKIAVFQDVEKTIFKDRKEFTGSILKQIEDTFNYINLLNKTTSTFKSLIRNEKRDYPLEAIMLGDSQFRNEKIANFFYKIHFIEACGTGIKKIMSSYINEKIKPTITAVEGAFRIILYNINT